MPKSNQHTIEYNSHRTVLTIHYLHRYSDSFLIKDPDNHYEVELEELVRAKHKLRHRVLYSPIGQFTDWHLVSSYAFLGAILIAVPALIANTQNPAYNKQILASVAIAGTVLLLALAAVTLLSHREWNQFQHLEHELKRHTLRLNSGSDNALVDRKIREQFTPKVRDALVALEQRDGYRAYSQAVSKIEEKVTEPEHRKLQARITKAVNGLSNF